MFRYLIDCVSEKIVNEIREGGHKTFDEMRKEKSLGERDIKLYICGIVTDVGCDCLQDMEIIQCGCNRMDYEEFRKAVLHRAMDICLTMVDKDLRKWTLADCDEYCANKITASGCDGCLLSKSICNKRVLHWKIENR